MPIICVCVCVSRKVKHTLPIQFQFQSQLISSGFHSNLMFVIFVFRIVSHETDWIDIGIFLYIHSLIIVRSMQAAFICSSFKLRLNEMKNLNTSNREHRTNFPNSDETYYGATLINRTIYLTRLLDNFKC